MAWNGSPMLVAAMAAMTDGGPTDMAVSANQRYLYVQGGGSGTIDVFRVGWNGSLTQVQTVTGLPTFTEGIAAIDSALSARISTTQRRSRACRAAAALHIRPVTGPTRQVQTGLPMLVRHRVGLDPDPCQPAANGAGAAEGFIERRLEHRPAGPCRHPSPPGIGALPRTCHPPQPTFKALKEVPEQELLSSSPHCCHPGAEHVTRLVASGVAGS